jgi:hypothetical protein
MIQKIVKYKINKINFSKINKIEYIFNQNQLLVLIIFKKIQTN